MFTFLSTGNSTSRLFKGFYVGMFLFGFEGLLVGFLVGFFGGKGDRGGFFSFNNKKFFR